MLMGYSLCAKEAFLAFLDVAKAFLLVPRPALPFLSVAWGAPHIIGNQIANIYTTAVWVWVGGWVGGCSGGGGAPELWCRSIVESLAANMGPTTVQIVADNL